jgi:hypothetical protein
MLTSAVLSHGWRKGPGNRKQHLVSHLHQQHQLAVPAASGAVDRRPSHSAPAIQHQPIRWGLVLPMSDIHFVRDPAATNCNAIMNSWNKTASISFIAENVIRHGLLVAEHAQWLCHCVAVGAKGCVFADCKQKQAGQLHQTTNNNYVCMS